MNYDRLEKHLETIRGKIDKDTGFQYHEKLIDIAFSAFVEKHTFKDVLDVGFGQGYSLNKFKSLGVNLKGITQSEQERQAAHFIGHDVQVMDMAFLDFEDKSFDLVWCRHALEHSVMPLIALMEFHRVLRDGGHLYVEVPADSSIQISNAQHLSMFSDAAWQELFRKSGFHLIFRSQFPMHFGNEGSSYYDLFWQYWMKRREES